eukprot:14070578-Ditylum_brightwellii.AAC.1
MPLAPPTTEHTTTPPKSDPSPSASSADSLPTHTRSDDPVNIRFQKLHPNARVPRKASDGAAGYDLSVIDDVTIPHRMYDCISPRSGLSVKYQIDVSGK